MDKKVTLLDKIKNKIEDYKRKMKQKKEEEKKKKEEIRIWQLNNYGKYYSKPKVVLLTVVGLFFGLFEKKKETKEIKLNKIETKDILIKDDSNIELLIEEIKEIEKEINEIKEIKEENIKEVKDKVTSIKEKTNKINEKTNTYRKTYNNEFIRQSPRVIPEVAVLYEKNNKKIDVIEENVTNIKKEVEKKESKILEIETEKKQKEELLETNKLKTVEELEKEKLTEEEINKYLKENMTKEEALIVASILNSVNENKSEEIDKKEIKKENDNKEKINETEKSKKEELKKENVQKKEKVFKRTENDLAEIRLMETLIYNNLKKQRKEIEKYRKKIEKLDVITKKKGFLSHVMLSIRNVTRLVFSLFPLSLFKNKKLGLLTSAIFVNNSIRNMRNSVNKVTIPYIEYDKIAYTLRKEEKETESAIMICYDSLEQIEKLKEEFLLEVGYEKSEEIDKILKSIGQLEKMVESRAKELDKTYNKIQNVKGEGKQKIKRLEDMYDK